jgi:hypothetical protein
MSRRSIAPRRLSLFLGFALAAALALPGGALAKVSGSYSVAGIEVWATVTVGTFVGTAVGSDGDLATWQASIAHTPETQPVGYITGGYARLITNDLTRVRGNFTSGSLRLVDDGPGDCGDLTHRVRARLTGVTRSDSPKVGTGWFIGKLIHFRVSIFGRCIPYSATATGTISLSF